jgi:hypothetical protein
MVRWPLESVSIKVVAARNLLPLVALIAIVIDLSPSSAEARAGHGMDWGSVTRFVGTYHAVTIQVGGRRSEVSGRVSLALDKSSPVRPGQMEYIFDGIADATVRNSGPTPNGCAAMGEPPNLTGHAANVGIVLHINTADNTYDWNAQPLKLSFQIGGYTPECGSPNGPKHMTVADYGMASVGNLRLPSTSVALCGKTVFTDPGDFTAYVNWYFYPKDVNPKNIAPACPSVKNATGGTS